MVTAVRRTGLFFLLLLLAMLPFELQRPLLTAGPLVITNVEAALLAVLGCTGAAVGLGLRPVLPPRWWWWLGVFAAAALLSALTAPEFRGNALKGMLRLLSGMLLALAVPQLVRGERRLRAVTAVLLATGLVSALLGIWEIVINHPLAWLDYFRPKITVAGQFLRLTGPFDYANQAAMFLEVALFFWLAWAGRRWLFDSAAEPGGPSFWTASGMFLITLQAVFLTFSRAAWGAIFLSALSVSLLFVWSLLLSRQERAGGDSDGSFWRDIRARRPLLWSIPVAGVLGLLVVNIALFPVFSLRLQDESDNAWYLFAMEMPAELTLTAGETAVVSLTLYNSGKLQWDSTAFQPINLGARWVSVADGREYSQPRWPLPQVVYPGDGVQLDVPLRAPVVAGDYLLHWDLVQEKVVWFGEKNGRRQITQVTVLPPAAPTALTESPTASASPAPVEFALPIPGRLTLWQVALQQWSTRPFTGIGLDNFRLTYGEYLDAERWNETVHTNNMYLEILVSVGVLGAIPFFVWLGLLMVHGVTRLWRMDAGGWETAVFLGLLAFLLHGLLDFFLLFNATGLLFWLLAGLWITIVADEDSNHFAVNGGIAEG